MVRLGKEEPDWALDRCNVPPLPTMPSESGAHMSQTDAPVSCPQFNGRDEYDPTLSGSKNRDTQVEADGLFASFFAK